MIKLEDCTEISQEQYLSLANPCFEAQTRVDSNGYYWMVFSSNGEMYSIKCQMGLWRAMEE